MPRRTTTHRSARAPLLQLPQDDDLRRVERDPAQHHREAGARGCRREIRLRRRAAPAGRLGRSGCSRATTISTRGAGSSRPSRDSAATVWKAFADLGLLGLGLAPRLRRFRRRRARVHAGDGSVRRGARRRAVPGDGDWRRSSSLAAARPRKRSRSCARRCGGQSRARVRADRDRTPGTTSRKSRRALARRVAAT